MFALRGTMKICRRHINIILLLAGALAGCESSKDQKELSQIELHLETSADGTDFTQTVPIYRAAPNYLTVERSSSIDERDLVKASVVDENGFAIQLQFDEHGVLVLENLTRGNPGRRIAVLARFGESRWLAAPLSPKPIIDGKFTFTPDATREEAERIVRGLNNEVEELKKKN
jgi:preprotein translocase subunit SecD